MIVDVVRSELEKAADRLEVIKDHLLGSKVKAKMAVRTHPDPVSCHILDTSSGCPAKNVSISMWHKQKGEGGWTVVATRVTNDDGRASAFLQWDEFTGGTYKMRFETGTYYGQKGLPTFYPYAEVVFEIKDPSTHYHIPLLVSNYGYSTYKGS